MEEFCRSTHYWGQGERERGRVRGREGERERGREEG